MNSRASRHTVIHAPPQTPCSGWAGWRKTACVLPVLALTALPCRSAPFLELQGIGNPFIQLSVAPYASLPLGDFSSAFSTGVTVGVSGTFRAFRIPVLALGADAYYTYLPVRAETSLSVAGIALGPAAVLCLTPQLQVRAHLSAGAYAGYLSPGPMGLEGELGWGPIVQAGAAVEYFFSPFLSVGLVGRVTYYWGEAAFLEASPVVSYHIPTPQSSWLQIRSIEFEMLFPSLYRQYETDPPGRLVVTNTGRFPVKDLQFELSAEHYMRQTAVGTVAKSIQPGESLTVALPLVLSESIMGLTEGAELTASCQLAYSVQGTTFHSTAPVRLFILDRNALEWDDDRKACLFVTEKDPTVLELSGEVAASLRPSDHPLLTVKFQKAAALFTSLTALGISYVSDPESSYSTRRPIEGSVDFLKFPRQTLAYRAGDCDDLSVLYCALLESVGIEAAIITFPGHVYSAFKCDLSPSEMDDLLAGGQDLIRLDSGSWIPVETTMPADGFLSAWEEGIRQWNAHSKAGDAHLYPVREAWKRYPPVGMPEENLPIVRIAEPSLVWDFEKEAGRMAAKYLEPRTRLLLAQGDTQRIRNKIGILCARFGLYERALEMFKLGGEYVPALVNSGILLLLMGRPSEAVAQFEKAGRMVPSLPQVQDGLARAYSEIGDFERSRSAVSSLEQSSAPETGHLETAGHPGSGARSNAGAGIETVQWVE
jgi:hypothetical protein